MPLPSGPRQSRRFHSPTPHLLANWRMAQPASPVAASSYDTRLPNSAPIAIHSNMDSNQPLPTAGQRHSSRFDAPRRHSPLNWRLPRIVSGVSSSSYERHPQSSPMVVPMVERVALSEDIDMGDSENHNSNSEVRIDIDALREANEAGNINEIVRQPLFGIACCRVDDSFPPHDLGPMDVCCRHCQALHWPTERTASSTSPQPDFEMCCAHGKVSLPFLSVPPMPLYDLFVNDTNAAKEFRENIAQYNAALAFTSLGVDIDRSIIGHGPPVFRIHGELTHLSGSLLPERGQPASYAQLYVYDPQAAYHCRISRNENLSLATLGSLQHALRVHDRYSHIYQHAYEVLQRYDSPDCYMKLCVLPGNDPRRYNSPTADEVAVVLPGDNAIRGDYRDIILHLRPEYYDGHHLRLRRINEGHPAYVPLHYVLLFPHGESGWYQGMRVANNPRPVTLLQYTAFRIHSRPNEFSTILHGGRLFQRYLVDMFASIDQQRLRFIRTQQHKLRITMLSGIEDALSSLDDNIDLSQLGQRIILPASYQGGPRAMHQHYLDGMAIARHFKKIDMFLTMTANPKWPEITRELLPGQTAVDRPDLVSRVFQLKKKALLDAILKHGIFGVCVAHVYVIEFQKRGLPHMHLLIFLKKDYKLLTPEIIDTVISAQWPDPHTHPHLFDAVKKYMVHGPCGPLNKNAPCMKDGKCIHGYPKPFQEHTIVNHDGYPHYRRPNDGRAYEVRGFFVDNRWIVPYNSFCTLWMDCHINVECALYYGSMKYINKYIQKGGDCGTVRIHDGRDEVQKYIDGRYLSASEAAWRIFQFKIHDQHPTVIRLSLHLPCDPPVVFHPSADLSQVIENAENSDTDLTAFFKTNQGTGHAAAIASQLTYQDFPQFFTLKTADNNRRSKYWSLRKKKGLALGRIAYVGPTAGEKFYLRTLLMVVKAPKSFDDLKTVNGVCYPTFQEACLRRGLLEDDGEWQICLEDAATVQTGSQLRHLFATLLLFCNPAQPQQLWLQFRSHICDDLHHQLRQLGRTAISPEDTYDFGLYLIDNILHESGHDLTDFPLMPSPSQNWTTTIHNRLISQHTNYDPSAEESAARQLTCHLNPDQRNAFDRIYDSIITKQGKMFFIDGYGGTGKTYLYEALCHSVRALNIIILCVASTGLACLLLPGGQTAHSMFKIPIDTLDSDSICNIPKQSQRADLLRQTEAIIYDECLMTHKHCFEALDRTLQDLRNCPKPFGGITTMFGGDFQQILPVILHGSRADIVDAALCTSYLWPQMHILKLRKNMRLQPGSQNDKYSQWLLDIGHGRHLDDDSNTEIPSSMITFDEDHLIDTIYSDISKSTHPPPSQYFLDHAILAPRNSDVEDTNEKILSRMPGDLITCHSADSLDFIEHPTIGYNDIPQDLLHAMQPPSMPPSELHMKIGCPLILLRNLDPSKGLCNGTRMILRHAYRRLLEVEIIGGDHHQEKAFIPRVTLKPTTQYPFGFRRRQFPLRLAFAMTINKAQGQSVKFVGLHLVSPVFSHGQLYVALSRATSSEHVHVLLPNTPTGRNHKTPNIVYPEVLLD